MSKTLSSDAGSMGVGVVNPTLSFGLMSVSDWGTAMPFLDIAKSMRTFFASAPGKWGAMQTAQLAEGGYLDADGWPTAIPAGMTSIRTIWAWDANDANAAASRAGVYVLSYEGTGTVKLSGSAQVISSEPGRIVFENKTGGSMWMDITATDPAGTGDYIRGLSVVAEKNLALHEAGVIFNPDWISVIEDARELRFMDWMKTNNSVQSDWDARPKASDATWTGAGGVPVEVMVALANQTGTDPWFTMPAQASDEYIRAFATYVRDHLDPGLVAKVEYSNENWNSAFKQYHWLAEQSKAAWGEVAVHDYMAKRATETALIWDEVFGAEANARVTNVIATQTVNSWLSNYLLTAPFWKAKEPDGYVNPASVFDALAITTYFGGMDVSDPALREKLIAAIKDPNVDAFAYLAANLRDPDIRWSLPFTSGKWAEQKAVANHFGIDLVAYEGGQHVHHSFAVRGLTEADITAMNDFLAAFVRSPEMGALYAEVWTAWSQVSDGAFMQYGDVGAPSKFGSWGLLSALGDTTARAELLVANNAKGASWFGDGGGERYLQGVTLIAGDGGETLVGTAKADILIGGDGDDTIAAGAGNDSINGGAGHDTLLLTGRPSDYTITAQAAGHRIASTAGTNVVVNVEAFAFDGKDAMTLEQFIVQSTLPEPVPTPITRTLAVQGVVLDAAGATAVEVATTARGVLIGGVNIWSSLGKELGMKRDSAPAYIVHDRNAAADFDGATVKANYFSMHENRAQQLGPTLSASAVETATTLGSIATNVAAIIATDGDDVFLGRSWSDVVHGGAGNDWLDGRGGDDTIYGGDGNDVLIGGLGNDVLYGGAGSDRFLFNPGDGQTRIMDFTKEDTLYLRSFELTSLEGYSSLDANGDLQITLNDDVITLVGLDQVDLEWISLMI